MDKYIKTHTIKPINVLIVEDNRADIRLIEEIFKKGKLYLNLQSVENGQEAMFFLKKEGKYKDVESPDLILLDLNMPIMNGHEFLDIVKQDESFKRIPIIVMTISKSDEDVLKSYNLHANAYIIKPVELNQFISTVQSIENFWLTIAKLPSEQ
jgi:CheY-like chemotaxis protein